MTKKSQFYLFAIVLLCSYLFMSLTGRLTLRQVDRDFEDLYNNYIYEGIRVINSAEYHGVDVSERYDNFTLDFINYALQKNIDLGILYMIVIDNKIRIVNYLNEPVSLDYNIYPPILMQDEGALINRTDIIIVGIGDINYEYNITPEYQTQLKVLFRKEV
ncbi:hypothetical protein JW930_05555 [Candidatus Woesearchaeota archaeon]|nr:hypothetical protein [Candidatus Woesearchaeota archaeon]